MVFEESEKKSPQSYDLKGTVKVGGVAYRIGGYKAFATGEGKMAKGKPYFWLHRIEQVESNDAGTSFDPAALETK